MRRIATLLALFLLAATLSACGRGGPAADGDGVSPLLPPIALSVPADAIYLVDPVNGAMRRIAGDLPDFQSGFAAWGPDHLQLAYADRGIQLFDAATSRSTPIVSGGGLSMPAWSLDGHELAYSDGLTIWLTSLADVAPHRVHVPATMGPLSLAWAPGRAIAFQGVVLDCSAEVRCVSTGSSEIWTIRPDGTNLTQITHVGHAEAPRWSPDGTHLLYVRSYPGTGRETEVWTSGPTGREQRLLVRAEGIVAADWSPDGTRLVVVRRGDRPDTLELWAGRADGMGFARLGRPFAGTTATIDW